MDVTAFRPAHNFVTSASQDGDVLGASETAQQARGEVHHAVVMLQLVGTHEGEFSRIAAAQA